MIQFTPFDSLEEEARALSLLTAAQREDYRRRQFAYRIEQRQLQEQAQAQQWAQALKEEKEQKVSAAKKRQAANRAAHIAKCQEIRGNRNSNRASK